MSSIEKGPGPTSPESENTGKDTEEIRGMYEKEVPKEILDNFNDAISELAETVDSDEEELIHEKVEKLLDLDSDAQDRIAEIQVQMREGRSVANILYEAAQQNNTQTVNDLEKMGKLMQEHAEAAKGSEEDTQKTKQFGEVLQSMAQAQQVLMNDEQWMKLREINESGYRETVGGKLSKFADRTDVSDDMQNIVRKAAQKLLNPEPKRIIDQRKTSRSLQITDQRPNKEKRKPLLLTHEEKKLVTAKKLPKENLVKAERLQEEEKPAPETTFRQEKFKENVPQMGKQFRELMDQGKNFEAAQLLANMKRMGVSFKGKGTEEEIQRRENIKKDLVKGYEAVKQAGLGKNDGGLSAARYLTYLRYTGALKSASEERQEELWGDVKYNFTEAASEKGKDNIDWSLYAMHAKYVSAIEEVTDQQQERLDAQKKSIPESNTDKIVINEARLKLIDKSYKPAVPVEQVKARLMEHKKNEKYSAYARLASAYKNIDDTEKLVLPPVKRLLREYLKSSQDKAKQEEDWNSYLTDAANVDRAMGEGKKSTAENIPLALDESTPTENPAKTEVDETSVFEGKEKEDYDETGGTTETAVGMDSDETEVSTQPAPKPPTKPAPDTENDKRKRQLRLLNKPVLELNKNEIRKRERALQQREEVRRTGDKTRQLVQEVIDKGIDITKKEEWLTTEKKKLRKEERVLWIENILADRINKAVTENPDQQKDLERYNEMWLNELGRLNAINSPKRLDKISQFTEWLSAKSKTWSAEKRIQKREVFIKMLREERLNEDNISEVQRHTLQALADKYEELSLIEMNGVLEKKGPKTKAPEITPPGDNGENNVNAFTFAAVDEAGQEIKDTIEADNIDDANKIIKDMGYTLTSIKPASRGWKKSAGKKGVIDAIAKQDQVKENENTDDVEEETPNEPEKAEKTEVKTKKDKNNEIKKLRKKNKKLKKQLKKK